MSNNNTNNNINNNNNNNNSDNSDNNDNRSSKKFSIMKGGLIKLLFFTRFNGTCLRPRKNYVPHQKFFEIVGNFSIGKEISRVWCEGNLHWKLQQKKYMATSKKDGKNFRGQ